MNSMLYELNMMMANVHFYTAVGFFPFERKFKRVWRHNFLDSPVLQDEHQLCISMNCNLVLVSN